jgi:hypothetical protein
LKKQSQFPKELNERIISNNNGLCKFWRAEAARKQSQFKANFKGRIGRRVDSRFGGNDKYGIPARQKILTLFEKTNPILKGAK